jgi:hypothetical protein
MAQSLDAYFLQLLGGPSDGSLGPGHRCLLQEEMGFLTMFKVAASSTSGATKKSVVTLALTHAFTAA